MAFAYAEAASHSQSNLPLVVEVAVSVIQVYGNNKEDEVLPDSEAKCLRAALVVLTKLLEDAAK